MKKLLLTFLLFISVIGTATAPPSNSLIIEKAPIIYFIDAGFYSPLVDAMFKYEATNDSLAYNPKEQAYGGLQIRPCRLEHYNTLNGTNHTMTDCFDFNFSKKVFLYFCNHDGNGNLIPWKSWEQAAKDWNGSGPKTAVYWENVKQLI